MLCPLDSRYKNNTELLTIAIGDEAYTRNRVHVEICYLIELMKLFNHQMSDDQITKLKQISDLQKTDFERIAQIEAETKHDVKAIEYFIKEKLKQVLGNEFREKYGKYVHYGLTSQDVNSVGGMIGFQDSVVIIVNKIENEVLKHLNMLVNRCKNIPILCRTHGQFAVPSLFGKELYIYVERVNGELEKMKQIDLTAKFGGAVGNFNSLYWVNPEINWISVANKFVSQFNLERSQFTKQIDNYESISETLDCLKRILVILSDIEKNLWLYVSDDYFKQLVVGQEVGSSTMPQKVNPINLENARGNISIVLGLIDTFTTSLPQSSYQRDLKDSTMMRSIGMIFGYAAVVTGQLGEGIKRLEPNLEQIQKDLKDNVSCLTEAIQTYLKFIGIDNGYELMKELARGKKLTYEELHTFIDGLNIDDVHKIKMKSLTVEEYIGMIPDYNVDE